MPTSAALQRVIRAQRVRDVVINKVMLSLTVLRELRDGRAVEPRVMARSIQDIETLVASIDAYEKDFTPQALNAREAGEAVTSDEPAGRPSLRGAWRGRFR